jgi:hypothetical protein
MEIEPYTTESIIAQLQMTRWVERECNDIVLRKLTWETQPTSGVVNSTTTIMTLRLYNDDDDVASISSTAKQSIIGSPKMHFLLPIIPLYEYTP